MLYTGYWFHVLHKLHSVQSHAEWEGENSPTQVPRVFPPWLASVFYMVLHVNESRIQIYVVYSVHYTHFSLSLTPGLPMWNLNNLLKLSIKFVPVKFWWLNIWPFRILSWGSPVDAIGGPEFYNISNPCIHDSSYTLPRVYCWVHMASLYSLNLLVILHYLQIFKGASGYGLIIPH